MKLPSIILSHVDVINDEYISGWCFNRLIPSYRMRLSVELDGRVVGETRCDLLRDDVRQSGMHGSGICGFTLKFSRALDLEAAQTFTIRAAPWGMKLWDIATSEIQAATTPERPIFFMHVPKTAGTSFNNHVHGWFGFDRWHSHIEVFSMEKQQRLLETPQYVAGHLPFYRLNKVVKNLSAIDLHTIFREPVAQLHSHLSWIKGIGADASSSFFQAHQPVVRELALSLQSEDLSTPDGLAGFVERIEGFQLDFFDNIQVRYLLDARPERVSEQDLNAAINHLNRFNTIGLTEHYQEYLVHIAKQYGRRHLVQKTRHNPARVAPLFDTNDPTFRDILAPLTRYDVQLYQAVQQL